MTYAHLPGLIDFFVIFFIVIGFAGFLTYIVAALVGTIQDKKKNRR